MEFDALTKLLYQVNINWVYSIIKELDKKGIEKKEKFIANPYKFNNIVSLGYYFMNLYIVSNIKNFKEDQANKIMMSIMTGASSYNQCKLESIYKKPIDIKTLVNDYNTVVRVTKIYAPNDGLKARVVAVDNVYRKIYDTFNRQHFNIFVRVFMESFKDYEKRINDSIEEYFKES